LRYEDLLKKFAVFVSFSRRAAPGGSASAGVVEVTALSGACPCVWALGVFFCIGREVLAGFSASLTVGWCGGVWLSVWGRQEKEIELTNEYIFALFGFSILFLFLIFL
jgi:hypothetical protein